MLQRKVAEVKMPSSQLESKIVLALLRCQITFARPTRHTERMLFGQDAEENNPGLLKKKKTSLSW